MISLQEGLALNKMNNMEGKGMKGYSFHTGGTAETASSDLTKMFPLLFACIHIH